MGRRLAVGWGTLPDRHLSPPPSAAPPLRVSNLPPSRHTPYDPRSVLLAPQSLAKLTHRVAEVWRVDAPTFRTETVADLWSGYGGITRLRPPNDTPNDDPPPLIVKWVQPNADPARQPRGWGGRASHDRKLRSYQIERTFYRNRSSLTGQFDGKIANHHGDDPDAWLLIEDLDHAGYQRRVTDPNPTAIRTVITWLAKFHAATIRPSTDPPPQDLWPIGTYWHLDTRIDELHAMPADHPLRTAAASLDRTLRQCPYQCLLHGDAKMANFCFTPDRQQTASLDFQYVGGGVGVQDVVYFLTSVLGDDDCRRDAQRWFDEYFGVLDRQLTVSFAREVVPAWRRLIPVAWADFNRFLVGWCPTHAKLTPYAESMNRRALAKLTK